MNRKTLILIVIAIVVVFAGAFYFIILNNGSGSTNNTDDGSGFLGLFPGGGGGETGSETGSSAGEQGSGNENILPENQPVPKLRNISNSPISGFVTFLDEDATTTLKIRYIEKGTGHIYEADTASLKKNRISNTTIPRIREALWFSGGEEILIRYEDDEKNIQSFVGKLVKNGGEEVSLESLALPQNILSTDIFDDIIFSVEESSSGSIWKTYDKDGDGSVLAENPLRDWVPVFWSESFVSLQNKTSNGISSGLYNLNLNSVSLEKVLSGIPGLTSLVSPEGNFVFYSSSSGNNTLSFIYDTISNESTVLPVRTLAEKCVWDEEDFIYCGVPESLGENQPDAWYRGETSFNDSLWKISPDSSVTEKVFEFADIFGGADLIKMRVLNGFLFFENKKDSSLWSLDLSSI